MISACPSRASARIDRGVPGQVVAGLPDAPELGDGARIGDGPKRLDGLVAEVDLREVLDRLRVSVAKTVAAQERDELELAGEVGFFVEVRPEGARGLVAVDPAQGLDRVVADLRSAGGRARWTTAETSRGSATTAQA